MSLGVNSFAMIRARSWCVLGVVLASCGSPKPGPQHAEPAGIELTPASAEVWTPEVRVAVHARAVDQLVHCEIIGRSGPLRLTRANVEEGSHSKPEVALSARVALEPGRNRYVARCRAADGRVVDSAPVEYTLSVLDAPRARIRARSQGTKLVLDGTGSEPSAVSSAMPREFHWRLVSAPGVEPRALSAGASIEVAPPGPDGDYVYELVVTDERGASDTARTLARVRDGRFEPYPFDPAWIASAVVYGLIPPLFGKERPLAAVREALPSIAELGVAAIWISPLFSAAVGDFGYAVTDHFSVRADFGAEQDLKALVDAAHRLGVRVLLDFVPNHTAVEHRYFQQAEALGTKSHYYDFYERDARGNATHYFDWEHLPNLEFSNPEVARWITRSAVHWLERAALDGYRIDAAWGIREREPAFYAGFTRELRRVRPDAFLLAEASARDPYFLENGFDAAYDWTGEPGKWAWQGVFDAPTGIARRLVSALAETEKQAARSDRVFRFLNNNDTGERFITRHGVGLTRVATALLLTLPGIPCIYAFDEVGGEYEPYTELPPRALSHPELRELHRRLIALRRSEPALHAAGMRVLRAEPPGEVFAFLRHSADGAIAPVLVVLNFADQPWTGAIELSAELAAIARFRAILEPRQTAVRPVSGSLRVALPPFGYTVFRSD
jgi:glycosidase